jgi:hypothetical protein
MSAKAFAVSATSFGSGVLGEAADRLDGTLRHPEVRGDLSTCWRATEPTGELALRVLDHVLAETTMVPEEIAPAQFVDHRATDAERRECLEAIRSRGITPRARFAVADVPRTHEVRDAREVRRQPADDAPRDARDEREMLRRNRWAHHGPSSPSTVLSWERAATDLTTPPFARQAPLLVDSM